MKLTSTINPCIFLTIALITKAAFAQDQCDSVLKHGIYDFLSDSGKVSSASAANTEVCRAYQQYESDSRSGGASGSYSLFNASALYSAAQIKSLGEAMCSSSGQSFNANSVYTTLRSSISPAAVDAWRSCVAAQSQIYVKTTYSDTDQGSDGLTISFHATTVGGGAKVQWNRTDNLSLEGGPTLNSLINKSNAIPIPFDLATQAITCKRPIGSVLITSGSRKVYADNARLVVATTVDTITRDLPAVLPVAPPSPIPAGSVIAWYGRTGPVPIGWALCDGTGGTPDLRDRFLNGTGDYTKVGVAGGSDRLLIPPLFLATGGTNHRFALREQEPGNGIVNHQTQCAECNLVDSYVNGLEIPKTAPPFVSVMYLIKK